MEPLPVERLNVVLKPSHARVLIRPFIPHNEQRIKNIISRVLALAEDDVRKQMREVRDNFGYRHPGIEHILMRHFESVKRWMITDQKISGERKMLIGAYMTQEYALESSALFNPSIVAHPDQSGCEAGSIRFILSLRATGEGHISSIVFRQGIIDAAGGVTIVAPTPYVTQPEQIPNQSYDKAIFERKLAELGCGNGISAQIMSSLGPTFTLEELNKNLDAVRLQHRHEASVEVVVGNIRLLALSNYEVKFHPGTRPSERAIFPSSPSQSNGIEDARFVLFRDGENATYYATYTAFDGRLIIPQLLETHDFLDFRFITLNGPAAQNKGMALFPRKINGCYAMLSRQDNENIYLMYSDNIHFWYTSEIIVRPTYPWEFVQMGNCGSPIEIDEGWLVLSHGVGPMRRYCMSAFLLDKNDPVKVIGRLSRPLLSPNDNEREGYVPNVVYTCGAMVHNGWLIIPYAMSDYATNFARVRLTDVLEAMEKV